MKELLDILTAYRATVQARRGSALATVVKVTGSAYRRPGAKMLIFDDGRTVGGISGGCLESDVAEHAKSVIASNAPKLVVYDTRSENDATWGVGMGCNGEIFIFIEPLTAHDPNNPLFLAERFQQRRAPGAIATVFQTQGSIDCFPGFRRFATQEIASAQGSGSHFSDALARALRDAFAAMQSQVKTITEANGRAETFVEYIPPPPHLKIFGGGPDAQPIATLAVELGWRVTIFDHRPSMTTPERFPTAEVVSSRYADIAAPVADIMLVMTHNYAHDRDILRQLLSGAPRYLGVLGPKRRTERILDELRTEGLIFAPETMANVYYPAGLDIGAETPQEIALSIVAEIRAALTGRTGAMLRTRTGPIH